MVPPSTVPDVAPAVVVLAVACWWFVRARAGETASGPGSRRLALAVVAIVVATAVLARSLLRSGFVAATLDHGGGFADAGPFRRFLPVIGAELAALLLLVAALERRLR